MGISQRRTLYGNSVKANKKSLGEDAGSGKSSGSNDIPATGSDNSVTPEDLSSALKNRLRLNKLDISNVTHDEVDISQSKYKPPKIELEVSSVPSDAIEYLNDTKKVKLKVINKWYTANDDVKQVRPIDKTELPQLAHGLESVLNSSGIQYTNTSTSKPGSNKNSVLKHSIDHLNEFGGLKSELVGKFVSPSKDETLLALSRETGSRYFSSTSSMTSTLFQFYMFLNNYDAENPDRERFKFGTFTKLMRTIPSVIIVSEKTDGISSIEVDKSCDSETFLSKFGHIAEILLTNEKKDMELYKEMYKEETRLAESEELPFLYEELVKFRKFKNPESVYNISTYDKMLMRSQLDCYSPLLQGNGTFDLKSRAISDIRFDTGNVDMENTSYTNAFDYASEVKDLVRTGALLKYSFQARIGQMNGIFLAFHNLKHFLGYEYLPLPKIDQTFYNDSEESSYLADIQFKFSIKIWRSLLDTIKNDLKSKNFRVVLKSERKWPLPFHIMKVHAVPMSDEKLGQLHHLQTTFKNRLDELTQIFLNKGLSKAAFVDKRETIFKAHKASLDDFNDSLADRVVSYSLESSDYSNGGKLDLFKFPSMKDKWVLNSRIVREEPDPKGYKAQLSKMTRLANVIKTGPSKSAHRKEDKTEKSSSKLSTKFRDNAKNMDLGESMTALQKNQELIRTISRKKVSEDQRKIKGQKHQRNTKVNRANYRRP